ncbi:MAG: hypothetical protein LIO62_02240, partial [Clostridiales bacterium]|nr:hypothetical protein [Clostridiales bacterium]
DEEMEFSAMGEVLSNELGIDVPDDVVKDLASEIKARQTLADMIEPMDEDEFCDFLGAVCEPDTRDDKDFVLNPVRFGDLLSIAEFLNKVAKRDKTQNPIKSADTDRDRLDKGYVHLSEEYKAFSISGNEIQEFIKILSLYSMEATEKLSGNVEIAITIPDVYVHKDESEREKKKKKKILEKTYADLMLSMQSDNFDEYDMCPPEEIGVANYNKKYELNSAQYKKVLLTTNFLKTFVDDGKELWAEADEEGYEYFRTFPPEMVSGQTGVCVKVQVISFNPYEKEIKDFCKILSYCSEFELRCAPDTGVIVQCTIPDVYVLKDN